MHPVLLSLGHFRIYSYGALIALGGVFATIFWLKHWKPMGLKREDDVWILVNTLIISGFLGGRILYVFQYDPWFGRAFFSDLFSLNRGFCVMGAILSVILGIYLYARFLKLQFLRTLDYVCQAAPLWHFFGRLGCFSAGCCYGIPTSKPWGVKFTNPQSLVERDLLGIPIHPTQLYEAFGELGIFFILYFFFLKRLESGKIRPGVLSAAYIGGYGVLRYILEFYRGDALWMSSLPMTQVQAFCLIQIVIAGIILWRTRHASHSA